MDLAGVLADGTDGLGNVALARYYSDIFAFHLPHAPYPAAFRVRAAVHFGVQQLATRSRVAPDRQRYLQVGGFDAWDLPAALIQAMPHTRVARSEAPCGTDAALQDLRARLPADAMPRETDAPVEPGCFGLIAVFATGAAPDPARWQELRNDNGRILVLHRARAADLPVLTLHG